MNNSINRRKFVKTLGAGTSFLAVSSPFMALNSCKAENTADNLYELFVNPDAQAKPFYRWWWNGNRVTKEEVIRELEIMKSAGAGGVEINPIALHPAVKNPSGVALDWLSPEWIEVLKTSIDKGKELGMISDMIIGTGWPFGGKFLDDDETIQGFDLFTERVEGPIMYSFKKEILKPDAIIKQARLSKVPLNSLEDSKDITDEIRNGAVAVPKGEYEISIISWRNKFREVANGAPGGDGPVLDHFNKTAVEKYLKRTSDGLKPVFGEDMGKYIRSMFCDSIELEGANWTGDFRQEFEKRNGYDVWEYLPLILNTKTVADDDFADTLLRIRYDYYHTLSEIFMERFVVPFHEWCHEIGVRSRYQAYGHPWVPTDLLDGNLVPDIPEGDQWLFNAGWTSTPIDQIRYAIWDKYTSSAAHLRGLKIASCEAMTNTSGVFSASLEYIKQATDLNITAGINHLVLHGWNYSPPEAGFPGWIRFGTWFNEKNPWFPYLNLWSDYAARLNAVFQNSQAVAQVAIIGPTADRWSESGLDRNPFLLDPWYLHSIWQAMNHHGYCSDYLNPRIFSEATYEHGRINYGPMSYQALIVCGMKTATPEFVDVLLKYSDAGGKIIFIETFPTKGPGMKYKDSLEVEKKIKALLNYENKNITIVDSPPRDLKEFTKWTGNLLALNRITPGVKISNPHELLFIYQAEHLGKPVFFFSNQNRFGGIRFEAIFEANGLTPWKWDAETGEKTPLSLTDNTIRFGLKTLESVLIIFSNEKQPEITKINSDSKMKIDVWEGQDISADWTAECIPPEGNPFTVHLTELTDLSKLAKTNTFGGTIIYRKTLPFIKNSYKELNLGKVAETVEVKLNGKNLGVKWWGEKTFDISKARVEGENKLEIKVTTLLWNYCNSFTMEENPMAKHWANANRDKSNKPLPVGLIGPVIIS